MEYKGKESAIVPEGVFIIGTYDENGVPNAMNAAWGIQSDYDTVTFFLASHKTTDNVKKTKAFTVAFATEDTVEISDYFGIASGRKVDKIKAAGVHVHKGEYVNAPIIEEYPVTVECEMVSYSDETGILTGRIIAEHADDSVITDGKIDLGKLKPIMFDSSIRAYRKIGPVVAKAWDAGKKFM